MSTVPSLSPTLTGTEGELSDFGDRWPAMVVKELRQGLRARGFVVPFLVLHALVLTAVSVEYLLLRTGSGATPGLRFATGEPGLFWIVVYLIVAGVMPLRLMESLRGESDGRNTELLLLGGLTRWGIVRGKWLVQAVLAVLALGSLVPYMLVRYFFGGVELVPGCFSMVSVSMASLSMSGCVLGASGYAGLGMRFFIITVSGFLLLFNAVVTESMIAEASQGGGLVSDLVKGAYIFAYCMLLHGLYAVIGLQLARGHLKLFLAPYEMSPTRGMVAMLLTAPFMLIAGGIATCGWGAIGVLALLFYAVCAFDGQSAGGGLASSP